MDDINDDSSLINMKYVFEDGTLLRRQSSDEVRRLGFLETLN